MKLTYNGGVCGDVGTETLVRRTNFKENNMKQNFKNLYKNFDVDKFWKGYCDRLSKLMRRMRLKKMGICAEDFTDEEIDIIVRKIYKDMKSAGTTTEEAEKSLREAFTEIQKTGLLDD